MNGLDHRGVAALRFARRSVTKRHHCTCLLQGRDPDAQYEMLATAHVLIDSAMVGVERIVLESAYCGLVVTVGEFRTGSDRLDIPLPWGLVFREDKGQPPITARATAAMECRDDLLPLMQPLVQTVKQSPAVFLDDVHRLFANDVHAMVVAW
jgi:hypothetical protein